ncbi:MAG TPA: LysR substrate-binding domain-containing protein, partial [Polyangia bacterium]
GHPLARTQRPLRADELGGVELTVLAEGHCLRDQALAACKRAHGAPFAATSLATLIELVADGEGVTLLPSLALPLADRRVALRRFVGAGPARTLALVWRRGAAASAALKQIANVIHDTTKSKVERGRRAR